MNKQGTRYSSPVSAVRQTVVYFSRRDHLTVTVCGCRPVLPTLASPQRRPPSARESSTPYRHAHTLNLTGTYSRFEVVGKLCAC